jgi:threonine/homoserine efflux transporter RhtA
MDILYFAAIGAVIAEVIAPVILAFFGKRKLKPFTCAGCAAFWLALCINWQQWQTLEYYGMAALAYFAGHLLVRLFKLIPIK